MTQVPLKTPVPPQGIIASLVTGFEAINARLELILLPLGLDLFLWFGPHLTILPLVPRVEAALNSLVLASGSDAATQRNFQALRALLEDYGATFNVFSFLSTAPLGVPSLLAGRGPMVSPLGQPGLWGVDSVGMYLLLWGVFVLGGLLLGALYFGGVAQQVRDKRLQWGRLLRQVWGDWARLTALAVLAAGVIGLLSLPTLLLTGLLALINPILGGLVWVAGLMVMLWLVFYGGFALHGILLQRRGLLGALWDSARLVQINLPYAAGLFVVVFVINLGLSLIWNIPHDDSWLLLLGLGGHAFISTALVAATFVFYQDRYRWWTEMRQTVLARAEAERRGPTRKV